MVVGWVVDIDVDPYLETYRAPTRDRPHLLSSRSSRGEGSPSQCAEPQSSLGPPSLLNFRPWPRVACPPLIALFGSYRPIASSLRFSLLGGRCTTAEIKSWTPHRCFPLTFHA